MLSLSFKSLILFIEILIGNFVSGIVVLVVLFLPLAQFCKAFYVKNDRSPSDSQTLILLNVGFSMSANYLRCILN